MKRRYLGFLLLALLCVIFLFLEIINDRFWLNDFTVYHTAAGRILHGENLYRVAADGHYIFKYSPTSALYFIPWSFLPLAVAKPLYWLFLSALIVYGFHLSIRLVKPSLLTMGDPRQLGRLIILSALVLSVHFLRELHLGQVNYLLLVLYLMAIAAYHQGRSTVFAILIAITLFIKPFGLIFVPYLVWRRKFTALGWLLAATLVLAVLPFAFYGSVSATWAQYQGWWNELQIELAHKQGLLEPANHTIFSMVARYTPLCYVVGSEVGARILQVLLSVGIGISFLWFMGMYRGGTTMEQKRYGTILDLSLLVAYIPLFAFTSANAFIFLQIPLILVLLHFRQLRLVEKGLAVLACVLIAGEQPELLGPTGVDRYNELSLVTIGAVIIIVLLHILRFRGVLVVEDGPSGTGELSDQ